MSFLGMDSQSLALPVVVTVLIARFAYTHFYNKQKCPFLTNHELKIVQDSWKAVAKLGAENVGILLFKNIFGAAPGALAFFSFRDEKNLYESPGFKRHAKGVVETVGVAVSMLEDVPKLVPVLQGLGAKHHTYGSEGNRIEKAHYDVVGASLIQTLSMGLGDKFTPELKIVWEKVYGVVASTMLGSCPAHK